MASDPPRPRELTKDDWIAMHTLIFVVGRIVCEQGVEALPPKMRELLVPHQEGQT